MRDHNSHWRRVGRAATSFLFGWAVSGAVWTIWARPWIASPTGGTGWADAFGFLLFVAGFAAIGWVVVVLPLVAVGNHAGWFFDPRLAALTGAVCGIGILLLEFAVFFHLPPWEIVGEAYDSNLGIFVLLAGFFGGTSWWTYTRLMSRHREPSPPAGRLGDRPDAGPDVRQR